MFRLRFTPDFNRQRKAFLAEKQLPTVELPESLERCLRFTGEVTVAGAGAERGGARTGALDIAQDASLRSGSDWKLWKYCVSSVRDLLLQAALIALAGSTFAAFSTLAGMRILKAGQNLSMLLWASVVYFAMATLSQWLNFKSGQLRAYVSMGVQALLAGALSRKLLRLSSAAASRQSSGNLKTLITSDVKNVGNFLDNFVRNFIPAVMALIVVTPFLIHFTGRAGVIGISVMTLVLPISLVLNRLSAYFQDRAQTELDSLTSLAGEWVKNIRLIRYLSWDRALERDVSGQLRKYMKVSMGQHFMACIIFGLSMSWWMVSILGVVFGARAIGMPLDLASFFGALWLLTFIAGYFTHLPNTIRIYAEAAPSMKRIARFLAEEEQSDFFRRPTEALGSDQAPAPQGAPKKVRFESVSFVFPGGKAAIQDLSVEIDLSRKLAVLGEIGSGKTTFLKLLCGELPPSQGRIAVEFEDGSVRDLWEAGAYSRLRECLAYVPQEPFVSSDLFANNVSLVQDADDQAVIDAAYLAELEADIAALPAGIRQEIGESGVNLSGGQRQRLNLARAYFSARSFLVLDDTLSAVDSKTEAALMDQLGRREAGLILVTHRTRELSRLEEVIVMKDGRIVEKGQPGALAADPSSHFLRILKAYESEDEGKGKGAEEAQEKEVEEQEGGAHV